MFVACCCMLRLFVLSVSFAVCCWMRVDLLMLCDVRRWLRSCVVACVMCVGCGLLLDVVCC